ncbi:MAG: hypothetical protein HYZ57_17060 [Acidobacteria bacterium]|nr:hypothetical protein [Acidobacteriota bacterium]MBI3281540.1 hypothetical protein [Acidobacteriota bacterium]
MRSIILLAAVGVSASLWGATLEKLSLEQMTMQSAAIVRGRVQSCAGEAHSSLIFTRCRVAVSEQWKGRGGRMADVAVLGGTARGLSQTFAGAPKLRPGEEYVFFLWAGRSGLPQVIGLSQGLFEVVQGSGGKTAAVRAASSDKMTDSSGRVVTDTGLEISVDELRRRVARILSGGAKQ